VFLSSAASPSTLFVGDPFRFDEHVHHCGLCVCVCMCACACPCIFFLFFFFFFFCLHYDFYHAHILSTKRKIKKIYNARTTFWNHPRLTADPLQSVPPVVATFRPMVVPGRTTYDTPIVQRGVCSRRRSHRDVFVGIELTFWSRSSRIVRPSDCRCLFCCCYCFFLKFFYSYYTDHYAKLYRTHVRYHNQANE
jgi:hypothetical protein